MTIDHEFEGRRPSLQQLHAAIRKARAQGADYIVLRWGENQINLEATRHTQSGWWGHGWIGKHGGGDIARTLKRS